MLASMAVAGSVTYATKKLRRVKRGYLARKELDNQSYREYIEALRLNELQEKTGGGKRPPPKRPESKRKWYDPILSLFDFGEPNHLDL